MAVVICNTRLPAWPAAVRLGLWLWLGLYLAPVQAAPVDYQLTPTHSFVHFEWLHAGLSTLRGRFDNVSGRVTLDREAGRGSGQIELRLDSINTGRAALDAALRQSLRVGVGPQAETTARFEITALRFDAERPVAVLGRFHWHRQVMPIELRTDHFNCYLNPLLLREVCGGEFDATVEPAALGLVLDPAFGLGGPIRLRVQVEGIRQEAGS